jgi:catechol 2,3-dioxygenase-like lactoylglutathione lyase family enzyme
MIDHVSIAVSDLSRSVRFYETVLAPLGYIRLVDTPARAAFGSKYPELWLNARPQMRSIEAGTGAHICLRARTTDAIDAAHRLALSNGGGDEGTPGLRQATQVVYYAAFFSDPDGNRIEIMTVTPAATA